MDDDHLQEGVGGIDPLAHDSLEEVLSWELQVLLGELEFEWGEHLVGDFHVSFHDGISQLADGVHDEGYEGSLEILSASADVVLSPAFSFSIKVVISPELLLQLGGFNLEFVGIDSSESGEGEGPALFSWSEWDWSHFWLNEQITHVLLLIGVDDDIDHINDSNEVLIHGFSIVLQLQDGSIDLVDHNNWLDLLLHGLSQNSLGLDTHSFDAIDNNQGTVCDS